MSHVRGFQRNEFELYVSSAGAFGTWKELLSKSKEGKEIYYNPMIIPPKFEI